MLSAQTLMADAAAVDSTAPAEAGSLADFIRTENRAEKARDAPDLAEQVEAPATADVAPAVAAADAAPAEPTEEPDVPAEPTTRDATGKFVKKDPIQARIDRAVAKQRDAERRASELEAQIRALQPKPPDARPEPVDDPADLRPSIDTFIADPNKYPDPYIAYADAMGEWSARRAIGSYIQQQRQEKAIQSRSERVAEVREAGQEKYRDYTEQVQSLDVKFPDHVIETLTDDTFPAPVRADLVYYLSTHADEARVIAQLPPLKAVLSLGHLAARFSAANDSGPAESTPIRSKAKPPIKPVGNSAPAPAPAGSVENADKFDLAAFTRIENAAERRRRQELRG